jgi:zinc protease
MFRNARYRSIGLIAGLLLAAVAYSQTLPPGVQMVTKVEGITEYSLPNGLHFLLFPDASQPKVTVNITYLVGSRFEGYGETGMAHLLEHMNFIQTTTRTNIKKEITDHGAQFNGTTDYDRTNYFETVNSSDENVKWALELEADRMINTRIEKALLDTEMTVVRNEFEMGENDPGNILSERVMESAYLWHAYGHPVIGNKSDIEKVPIENLAAFYKRYYQPDNALLLVAGKFDEAKALQWIVADFGKIPQPERKLQATYTVEPAQDGERSVTLRRVGDTQYVMALYHTPAATHPDNAPVQVLSGVLGDTPSGRLYKALVDNKKAVEANMFSAEQHDPGFIMATAQLQPAQSIDDARKSLVDTVEGLVKEPPSKEEVDRVKTRLLKNIELAMANSQYVAMMLTEYAAQGDWRMLFLERDRIKQVTPDDVLRVAKAYLKESNRTLGEFIPTKAPDRAEIPATPELAATFRDFKGGEAVAAGEVFEPSNANIDARVTRGKMANGLKVTLLPKKNRGGTVVANLTVRFGDEKSLFGKSAVAQLVGAVLMRGTKNKSRQQIQDEMDKLKAQINVSGGVNSATADIHTVEANLPGALKLAAEILREPSFPPAEFEQVRQQLIGHIEEGRSEPQTLAVQGFERRINSIYPRGDVRYVETVDEQIEDLKKVTLDEAKKFYEQFYGASEGEFTVVGQFDQAGIQKLGEDLFGNWKGAAAYARILTPYRKIEPENVKIETPDKQNALSIAGQMFKMSDEDPDYPAAIMANYILGGTFSARLVARIRSKEGLSYGVGSQINVPTRDDGATFLAYAISNPENAPKVEASFMDEVARTIKGGFTAEELADAKKAWAEERLVGRSQDESLSRLLTSRARWGRTMQFDQALESKVAALTLEQVSAALGKAIGASGLIYVKAGDFKKAGVYQ